MSQAPQGVSFGRAPPSLRCPPAFTAIHLSLRAYNSRRALVAGCLKT